VAFIGGKARAATIDLEWPVHFAEKDYYQIVVRRVTVGEIEAWMKEIAGKPDDGVSWAWPCLRGEDDEPLPPGLLDALDVDDLDAVNKAVLSFLPKRFRGAQERASESQDGGTTN
jgi:hypothetical protein